MTDTPSATRRPRWGRRLLALALFAVQGGIAVSPLWEPHDQGMRVHAEQDGSRHTGLHNEATCVVCAIRSLHAIASTRIERTVVAPRIRVVSAAAPRFVPSPDNASTNLSRAPPLTG